MRRRRPPARQPDRRPARTFSSQAPPRPGAGVQPDSKTFTATARFRSRSQARCTLRVPVGVVQDLGWRHMRHRGRAVTEDQARCPAIDLGSRRSVRHQSPSIGHAPWWRRRSGGEFSGGTSRRSTARRRTRPGVRPPAAPESRGARPGAGRDARRASPAVRGTGPHPVHHPRHAVRQEADAVEVQGPRAGRPGSLPDLGAGRLHRDHAHAQPTGWLGGSTTASGSPGSSRTTSSGIC